MNSVMLCAPLQLTLIRDSIKHEEGCKLTCNFSTSSMDNAHTPNDPFVPLGQLELCKQLPAEQFMSLLQTCRETRDAVLAKQGHVCLCESGLDTHTIFANRLVDIFVSSRKVHHAQQAFNKLIYRLDTSYNLLIQGYSEYGDLDCALSILKSMQGDYLHPSRPSLLALLKCCTRMMCVARGHEIFREIVIEGLELDPFISASLVDMYAKCGFLLDAQDVFDELPSRDVVMWTSLISAYAEQGHLKGVLYCLERMQAEGVFPDSITFIPSLKCCGNIEALEQGYLLHSEMVKVGLHLGSSVGNTLVDMYAKCGSLAEAEHVFNDLPTRDVVTWSALLNAYAEQGLGDDALTCLEKMQQDGLLPNAVTYICTLKACTSMGVLCKGQKVHAHIAQEGYEKDDSIRNSLIYMYAKYGALAEAREVFNELPVQNVIPWNLLISGYADRGLAQEALNCFERMERKGVSPDIVTFVCSLRACGTLGDVQVGHKLHTKILKAGYEIDSNVGNALVDVYVRCGSLTEAQRAFYDLPVRDVVSWNTLIAGYNGCGLHKEALDCFDQMYMQGVSMDAVSTVCGLQACGGSEAVEQLRKLHDKILKEGYERDLVIGNSLVDTYVKCHSLTEAQDVFDKLLPSRNVISWTAIILGSAEQGESAKAFIFYAQMQEQGVMPNNVSFMSLLKACGNATALETGKKVHAQICNLLGEQEGDEISMDSALVDMYAMCGSMDDAQQVFDAITTRDHRSWTTLITGYARQGESTRVLQLFEIMRSEGFHPSEIAFLSVLNACSRTGFVEDGQKYYEVMSKEYGLNPNIKHLSCMVDLLCRAGQINEAILMLEGMYSQTDLVLWKMVLSACKRLGNVDLGRQAFEEVIRLDKRHNAAFILMSSIYAGAQMWEEARNIDTMRQNAVTGGGM